MAGFKTPRRYTRNDTTDIQTSNLEQCLYDISLATDIVDARAFGGLDDIIIAPTKEQMITSAIQYAAATGKSRVFIPTSMTPFNAALVTFNSAVQLVLETSSTNVIDVQAFGAKGNGSNDDTAAIQAAITNSPDGSIIDLGSAKTYLISGTITIAKRITIRGGGWGTVLQVAASVGATTDVFLLKPSTVADVQGMRFQDFAISPVSGTPARSAFMIDGTNASIANVVFDHVRVDTLGSYAFNTQNMIGTNSSINGSPYTLTIRDCAWAGGLNLDKVGDTVNIHDNIFTGVRDIVVNQIGQAVTNGGAHGFVFVYNNVTVNGGSIIKNAWQGLWGWNDMESPNTSTEANGALLDIQGNASANVEDFQVIGNFLGATNVNVAIAVRVDRATSTFIGFNYMAQGSASPGGGATVTANAIRTNFVLNRHAPDNPLNSWLNDAGAITWGMENDQSTGLMNFFGNANSYATTAGVKGVVISSAQVKINPTNGLIGGTSGDPSSTGLDVSLSRLGAGQFSVNTNAFNNSLGSIVQTGSIDLGTSQVKRLRANRGTALVIGDVGSLSAGWGSTASVSAVSGSDGAGTVSIASAGVGQAANATFVLTFHDGTWTQPPVVTPVRQDNNAPTGSGAWVTTVSATAVTIAFTGVPVAGTTYTFAFTAIGTK